MSIRSIEERSETVALQSFVGELSPERTQMSRIENDKENKRQGGSLTSRIADLVRDAVEECGCTLWDVDIVKEGGEKSLVIYIDKPDGISLDDCEMVNDAVDPIIEEADPIKDSYYLEISSPGLERELKTDAHLAAFTGSEVCVKLYAPLDGRKQFNATLGGVSEDGGIVLSEGDREYTLERKLIAKISTVADF